MVRTCQATYLSYVHQFLKFQLSVKQYVTTYYTAIYNFQRPKIFAVSIYTNKKYFTILFMSVFHRNHSLPQDYDNIINYF